MRFHTKVVGVCHDGRQSVIEKLYRSGKLNPGKKLLLRREPNNPYDIYAVAVLTEDGNHLGYIPKETAKDMSITMWIGMVIYKAYVEAVTGGGEGMAYGINLIIDCNVVSSKNDTIFEKPIANSELPVDAIDVWEIDENTVLTHKAWGKCVVAKVEQEVFLVQFSDGTERKFIKENAHLFFYNVYKSYPVTPENPKNETSGTRCIGETDYSFEDCYENVETDSAPDEESYEYYYGDDEIVEENEFPF